MSGGSGGGVFGPLMSHEGTCVLFFYFLLLEEAFAAAQMSASAAKWSRSSPSKRLGGGAIKGNRNDVELIIYFALIFLKLAIFFHL